MGSSPFECPKPCSGRMSIGDATRTEVYEGPISSKKRPRTINSSWAASTSNSPTNEPIAVPVAHVLAGRLTTRNGAMP